MKKSVILPETAIEDKDYDLLDRDGFAGDISNAITGWSDRNSIVIALYGKWGDGKTSVKNLIINKLKEEENISILVFNPWSWENGDQISKAFFKELTSVMRKSNSGFYAKIASIIEEYSDYIELTAGPIPSIAKVLRNFLAIISASSVLTVLKSDNTHVKDLFSVLTLCFSVLIPFSEKIAITLNKIIKINLSRLENLENQKKIINKKLEEGNKKFLIVLDDIDRMNSNEIRALFQLIKNTGNFSNLIFLALFDRHIVETSLSENHYEGQGKEYLKKIVTVGINLPCINDEEIRLIIVSDLNNTLDSFGIKGVEQKRWEELYDFIGRHYFKNVRDVKKFISSFRLTLSILIKDDGLNVNIVDLLGLEVIKIFDSSVYEILFRNKIKLISDSVRDVKYQDTQFKEFLMMVLSKSVSKDASSRLIRFLFPNLAWIWDERSFNDTNSSFSFRINTEECFDRYFRFKMSADDFNSNEINSIRSLFVTDPLFASRKYVNENRKSRYLNILLDLQNTSSGEEKINILSSCFLLVDVIQTEKKTVLGHHVIDFELMVYKVLQDIPSSLRFEYLSEIILSNDAVFLPLDILSNEIFREERNRVAGYFLFNVSDKERLSLLFQNKIELLSSTEKFKTSYGLPFLLGSWKRLFPLVASKWIETNLEDTEFLVSFFSRLISEGYSSGGDSLNGKKTFRLERFWVNQFFDNPLDIIDKLKEILVTKKAGDTILYNVIKDLDAESIKYKEGMRLDEDYSIPNQPDDFKQDKFS